MSDGDDLCHDITVPMCASVSRPAGIRPLSARAWHITALWETPGVTEADDAAEGPEDDLIAALDPATLALGIGLPNREPETRTGHLAWENSVELREFEP